MNNRESLNDLVTLRGYFSILKVFTAIKSYAKHSKVNVHDETFDWLTGWLAGWLTD